MRIQFVTIALMQAKPCKIGGNNGCYPCKYSEHYIRHTNYTFFEMLSDNTYRVDKQGVILMIDLNTGEGVDVLDDISCVRYQTKDKKYIDHVLSRIRFFKDLKLAS